MGSSNSQSPSDESASNASPEVRRRVTKACQRCRLKKCKCDGSSPCGRCKADDAICAYGKHKKSDKTVYRRGYVQMLERQHAQLISGVHQMYKLLQKGDGWPGAKLEPSTQIGGQPLTHQILDVLGVLQISPQDDAGDPDEEWNTFEHHPQDDGIMNISASASPVARTQFSPMAQSFTQPTAAPPYQTLTNRRRSQCGTGPLATHAYDSTMPQPTTFLPYLKQDLSSSSDMAYPMHSNTQRFSGTFSNYQCHDDSMGIGDGNPPARSGVMDVGWIGMEDIFDNSAPPMQLA